MPDYLVQMGITFVLAAINEAIKNPASKDKWKSAMYKIWLGIGNLFPEFQAAKEKGIERWTH